MRRYALENGRVYEMPDNHCVFCKHCTDVFWDYSHGPYGFCCELEKVYDGCDSFEDDGYVFDEKEWMEKRRLEIVEHNSVKHLTENEEFKKTFDEEFKKAINKLLFGDEEVLA